MWFEYKKRVAPIYQDETYRRLFATASGRDRPKGVDKLKKMKLKGSDEVTGWRRWFGGRSKRGPTQGSPTPPL
ncbi:MAG: hypothetical protein JSV86_04030 [Gemmatimonadota bacterium]|nr:MAG: hypothetical protein JSV86_04030 [Gemmatimonadota bacterium]